MTRAWLAALVAVLLSQAAWATTAADPFAWLAAVRSPAALAWVRAHDAPTLARLRADPRYAGFATTALALAQDPDRIPVPQSIGGQVYNLWQDAEHKLGVWRRTTQADYRSASPHWTTVIDLDALSAQDHAHWVFRGATCFKPAETRCLIGLSDGGEDAVTTREFDLTRSRFVPGGFFLPHAKMVADWMDADTILVATDWGAGSMTRSGYPYVVKKLRRAQPLADAAPYFSGAASDEGVELVGLVDGAGHRALIVQRELDFFRSVFFRANAVGVTRLKLPEKLAIAGLLDGRLIVLLNEAGGGVPAGSLAALDLQHADAPLVAIFTPGPRQSVQLDFYGGPATTQAHLLVVVEDAVRGRALVLSARGTGWQTRTLSLPDNAAIEIVDASPRDDHAFLTVTGFLQPTTLYAVDLDTATAPTVVKSLPAQFDASREIVEQRSAVSADGTRVPYFIVHDRAMQPTGRNPTLLYAYGGFGVSMTPAYNAGLGKLWLEHGGVYVLANIRGGGEFGPAWHEAGLKTHRQRVYDDFFAVSRDLIATHVTDPAHLGIRGGSNGGLLMGVAFTQHPELYRAVIIDIPLLDMLGYEHLSAGASWVGEYGSVANPAERAFLARISPYNNLHAGTRYPEPFIFTTTKDDRVGPVHARKFAARLEALGKPLLYYEATEGGHAAGADLAEKAQEQALEFTYLARKLMPVDQRADQPADQRADQPAGGPITR